MRMRERDATRLHRLRGKPGECPNELVVANHDWLHGRFRLPVDWPGFADTGPVLWPTVVFHRDPVVITQFNSDPVVADANTTIIYNPMRTYTREALTEHGERSEWYSVSPLLALEIARSLGLPAESAESLAPFTHTACTPALYRDQRRLSVQLVDADSDPVQMSEAVFEVFRRALEPGVTVRQRRSAAATEPTRRTHRELAENAKAVLAQRFGERLTLDELSDELEVSPFHLARTFRHWTGQTVHKYLTALRIAAALDHIATGMPLTDVASSTGFSSHSHFTQTFGSLLGESPSAWRRKILRPVGRDGTELSISEATPDRLGSPSTAQACAWVMRNRGANGLSAS
ncbi:MAG: helix-turn-helix transcriptional regulator [Phycisphaerales bacterium]|nr:helix-turn-helix transcriptional regulator [Phycisphaerales bacterium]